MLKKIPKILSPELVKIMMEMGHGDEIVIADGNFPSESIGQRCVRADGHGAPEILSAILELMPLDTYADPKVFGKAIGGDIVNNKKSWLMTRAFEKAGDLRESLTAAMAMPIATEQEKAAKISAVKDIYEKLGIGDDAKEEIQRLHNQAMGHIDALGLTEEKASTLRNYAATLLGRNK